MQLKDCSTHWQEHKFDVSAARMTDEDIYQILYVWANLKIQ